MTETQHNSDLETTLDNLEVLLEVVAVARRVARDRRRREVPRKAPDRPGRQLTAQEHAEQRRERSRPDSVDWTRDADLETTRRQRRAAEREERIRDARPEDALPPASEHVRHLMAEMAVEGRYREQVEELARATGRGGEETLEDPIARNRLYRAVAEEIAGEDRARALHARDVVAATGSRDLSVHDAEGEALQRELTAVRETEASREEQALAYAEQIAIVQERQEAERAERSARERSAREGQEFTSEIRLPVAVGAMAAAAEAGDESAEAVNEYVEQLGARLEDGEIVVPVEGVGTDEDARMDPAVSAWRSVSEEDLTAASIEGEEPANLAYLHAAADDMAGPDGEVPVPGEEPGQIRPTEDGLAIEAGIDRSDVSDADWDRLVAEFGDPEIDADRIYVPVSADPHADPAAEVAAAREELPVSVIAANQVYEQQLIARAEAAAAADDPGVWVSDEDAFVDLVEKQRPDGSPEAMIWVDEEQQPTTHPEGVPSVWMDQDGKITAAGHYEEGRPSGQWVWADENGTWASDRAEMGEDGPVPGTHEHRDSPEDGWTTVGEDGKPTSSFESTGPSSGPSTSDEAGPDSEDEEAGMSIDASPSEEPSPTPGPSRSSASTTPPLPEPSGPSHGPRIR